MTPAPNDEIYPTGAHVPGRAARLLKADLELMASPPMVWIRLAGGVVLCFAFAAVGLYIAAEIVWALLEGRTSTGGTLLPIAGIALAFLIAAVVVAAGVWATYRSYRRNGLL